MSSLALKYSCINEYRICQMLRPYGIKPSTVRIGKQINKGYHKADFWDAFRRYVPRADRGEWIAELERRVNLQKEANAEARKEARKNQEQDDEQFMGDLYEKLKKR